MVDKRNDLFVGQSFTQGPLFTLFLLPFYTFIHFYLSLSLTLYLPLSLDLAPLLLFLLFLFWFSLLLFFFVFTSLSFFDPTEKESEK